MWNFFILFLALCGCAYGLTEQEMKTEFIKRVMKCNKNAEADMLELIQLHSYVVPTKTATKCVLACAYKDTEVMNAQGLYDINHAYKVAEMMKNGNEKRLASAKKMADVCVKVNDVEVPDGDEGCERAALIFQCTIENAPKFGFKL